MDSTLIHLGQLLRERNMTLLVTHQLICLQLSMAHRCFTAAFSAVQARKQATREGKHDNVVFQQTGELKIRVSDVSE